MLTPSDKIRLIDHISKALAGEGWALIDLTLSQYGLPTTNEWNADKTGYVIWSAGHADDETLIALGKHLGLDLGRPVGDPDFWKPGFFRLFLSHLSSHKKLAAELQEALADYGISAFVAHADIEPGSEWQDQIELALNTCDGMAAIMTPEFHGSKWTDQEIGFAMGRGLLIVSVKAGQDPYGFIGKFQAVVGEARTAKEIAADLFRVFLKSKQTSERIKEGLVACFEQQAHFKEAIACSKLLEQVKDFSDPLRRRIRAAIESSRLLANAYGVPARIERVFPQSEDKVPETPASPDDVPF